MKRPHTFLFLAVLFLLLMPQPDAMPAEDSRKRALPAGQMPGTFDVKVKGDDLSVAAVDAPLAEVLREIGRQGKLSIESNIGPEEKITIRLNRVPLADGLRQLGKNVSFFYAQDTKGKARIERVVVLSEASGVPPQRKAFPQAEKAGQAAADSRKETPQQQPGPFKFEFDPRNVPEKKATPRKQP
jgi:hypothetical protein